MGVPSFPAERIEAQIASILSAWGMAADQVAITASTMTETDLWGIDSHGLSMLMMYEDMKAAGRLNVRARPRLVSRTPPIAHLDGDAGLGHPVARMGIDLATDLAQEGGVGVVTAENSHHFGAAGVYARRAVDRGCIALVTSTSVTCSVVPTRGAAPVLGTNPIAFAAPAGRNRPFVLDFATSAAALNKVKVYDFYGRPIPAGWVIDGQGQPVTDAGAAMAVLRAATEGGLNPIGGDAQLGGHKGYGLGVLAQILAGALAGGSFSPVRDRTLGPGDPYRIGHFFLAIDPKAFRRDGQFQAEVDSVIDTLHETPPVDPAQPVLVAGDPEAAERERRLVHGIPVPERLATAIREIAGRAGVPFLLGGTGG
ncbi:MAG: Ldh family oxidoreductase [Gemmatimonadota bacterium]